MGAVTLIAKVRARSSSSRATARAAARAVAIATTSLTRSSSTPAASAAKVCLKLRHGREQRPQRGPGPARVAEQRGERHHRCRRLQRARRCHCEVGEEESRSAGRGRVEEVGEAVSCQVEVETHPGAAAQEEVDAQDEQRHGTQQAGQQAARRPAPGEQADARERERGLEVRVRVGLGKGLGGTRLP